MSGCYCYWLWVGTADEANVLISYATNEILNSANGPVVFIGYILKPITDTVVSHKEIPDFIDF